MAVPAMLLSCRDERIKTAVDKYFRERDRQVKVVYNVLGDGIHWKICYNEKLRRYFLKDILIAFTRYDVNLIYLVAHEDCVVYGGSAAFKSSRDEASALHVDLWRAKRLIEEAYRNKECLGHEIKLLTVIKTSDDWQVHELTEEQMRVCEGTSFGFINSRAKRRMNRRHAFVKNS